MSPPSPKSSKTNLWSQLKPKGHKVTGSASSSFESATSIPAPAAPAPAPRSSSLTRMPLTFRDRGGRLQAFARSSSEGGNPSANPHQLANGATTTTNGAHPHAHIHANGVNGIVNGNSPHASFSEKRSDKPHISHVAAPPSVKQEMIDTSRFPLTKPVRYTAPPLREGTLTSQSPLSSPKLNPGSPPRLRNRANSDDTRAGLFSGSQLGEHFMTSGLTTPQNELAEPVDLSPGAPRDSKRSMSIPSHPSPERTQVDRRSARKSNGAAFVLRDDGFMTVVTGGPPSRHNSTRLKDGFQDGPVNALRKNGQVFDDDDYVPMSPSGREGKLPIRDVRIRSSYASRMEAYEADEEPRTSSPTLNTAPTWQNQLRRDVRRTTVFHDLDGDLESLAAESVQSTPKPSKAVPVQQRTLMESSMPSITSVKGQIIDKKRRRPTPDYDDMALTSMTYTDLQKQPFDFDPSKQAAQPGFGTAADSLDARLEQCRNLDEKDQRQFFTTLSIDDWEAAGEWFVAQFAGFMQNMREARQHKRRIIDEFEHEAAVREEAVRQRSDAIDRKLARMRQDGQRVVQDKEL